MIQGVGYGPGGQQLPARRAACAITLYPTTQQGRGNPALLANPRQGTIILYNHCTLFNTIVHYCTLVLLYVCIK